MHTIKVKIADLAVLRSEGLLITIGLGSCVRIALYDAESKVGAWRIYFFTAVRNLETEQIPLIRPNLPIRQYRF